MKITFERFLFIIAIPLAVIVCLEGYKYYTQELYADAIFNVICGIFILIAWVKEAFDKR